jgi:hypothetical protein
MSDIQSLFRTLTELIAKITSMTTTTKGQHQNRQQPHTTSSITVTNKNNKSQIFRKFGEKQNKTKNSTIKISQHIFTSYHSFDQ